ncbi:hypothetical protein AB0K09_26560 [Streptomyces sp. NPDC049577]|uniref:hypothetical protein n=1 Tax=Streptomyces sp. NPDC049577 TaxID=3155153 RepID=UPI00342148C5
MELRDDLRDDTRRGGARELARPSSGRHDFEPGKLIVGLVLLGGGLAYLAAADGRLHFPAYALLPALVAGLCLGGAASTLTFTLRHRARRSDADRDGAPRP